MVPDRRNGSYWGIILAIVGVIAGSTLLWFYLDPREPEIPAHQHLQRQQAGYQPGGPNCDPQRLARLAAPSRATANERIRCAEAAENYRLQTDDLLQQTRSADAAEEIVWLTSDQSRIAQVGGVLGFVTMAAAIAAAFYAGRAASETERTAKAAIASNKIALRAAEATERANLIAAKAAEDAAAAYAADRRAWISIEDIKASASLTWEHGNGRLSFIIICKNVGNAPAIMVASEAIAIVDWPIGPDYSSYFREIRLRAESMATFMGYKTVFPDVPFPFHQQVLIMNTEIVKCREIFNIKDDLVGMPVVLGSICYKSASDKSWKYTEFALSISNEERMGTCSIRQNGAPIPAESLYFYPAIPGGGIFAT